MGFNPATPIPATAVVLAAFDSSVDGFKINKYVDPSFSNLGASGSATAATTSVEWDGTIGSPTAGSLKISAPFTGWNQYVDVLKEVSPTSDWTGKKIHVRVKVDSGFVTDMYIRGLVQTHFSTGAFYAFGAPSVVPSVASVGEWQELVLDTATATFPIGQGDPTMVVEYGCMFVTGSGSTWALPPTPAVFHVDSFWLE